MEKRPQLFLELARLIGTETPQNNTTVVDSAKTKLDSLQYLRYAAHSGEPSLERIKDLCQKANESQCFYRSISWKQWLRTAITTDQIEADPVIHSNVVPRQAYLNAACLDGQQQCRGFFPASEISDGLAICRSCTDCALAEKMRNTELDHMPVDESNTLLPMDQDAEDVQELAQGTIYKILWRKGIFVRKRINCEGIFEKELKVVREVSHPNVVHCFGRSLWPNSADYDLFMELLDVDLQRFLTEEGEGSGSPFSFRDSLDVLLQVAEAMKHLHEKNFLHGDLKPHNIFMSRFELAHSGVQHYLVKVGDFGCAQRVDSSGATVDLFIPTICTTRYTAPEVFRCRPKYGSEPPPKHPQKMDVYSFGVVAYQVLTGVAKLYVGRQESRIAQEVIHGLRPNSGFRGTLDGDRSSLLCYIKRCWAEKPEERPSFSQICDELNRRSIEHGLCRGKNAKRKYHDSIGEGTNVVKLMKTMWAGSCEKALSDENGMA